MIVLIVIFLSYPIVTKFSISLVNCISLDETDNKYLYASPNIICWQGIHLKFIFVVGIFGIFLWGIFFPILLVFLLKRNLRTCIKTYDKKSPEKLNIMKQNDTKTILINVEKDIYLFFYKDYSASSYYWESVLFLYKFLLTLFPNLNSLISNEEIDIYFMMIILIYLFFLLKREPFKNKYLNSLDLFSNFVIVFSRFLVIILDFYRSDFFCILFGSLAFAILNLSFFLIAFYIVSKHNNWRKLMSKISHCVTTLFSPMKIKKKSIDFLKKKHKINF